MALYGIDLDLLRLREAAAMRKALAASREADIDPAQRRRAETAWAAALAAETARIEAEDALGEAEAGAAFLLMHAD